MQPSNNLIFNGVPKQIPQELIDLGCKATNYLEDGEPKFKSKKRREKVRAFILHESGGNYGVSTKNTLTNRHLGVHLILSEDGIISNHGDLVTSDLPHAGGANKFSVGIEVVNPYSPLIDVAPYEPTIPAEWWTWVPRVSEPGIKNRMIRRGFKEIPREYCIPHTIQLETLSVLIPWLCGELGIPYVFPSIDRGPKKLFKLDKSGCRTGTQKVVGKNLESGIFAHTDFSGHADGRYLLEHLYLSTVFNKELI
jgi:hypothetical protein